MYKQEAIDNSLDCLKQAGTRSVSVSAYYIARAQVYATLALSLPEDLGIEVKWGPGTKLLAQTFTKNEPMG